MLANFVTYTSSIVDYPISRQGSCYFSFDRWEKQSPWGVKWLLKGWKLDLREGLGSKFLHLPDFWELFPSKGREVPLHVSRDKKVVPLPDLPVPTWFLPRALGQFTWQSPGEGFDLEKAEVWWWVFSGRGERGCCILDLEMWGKGEAVLEVRKENELSLS